MKVKELGRALRAAILLVSFGAPGYAEDKGAAAVSAQARLQSDGLLAGPSDSLNKWKSVVASGILRHPLFAFVA